MELCWIPDGVKKRVLSAMKNKSASSLVASKNEMINSTTASKTAQLVETHQDAMSTGQITMQVSSNLFFLKSRGHTYFYSLCIVRHWSSGAKKSAVKIVQTWMSYQHTSKACFQGIQNFQSHLNIHHHPNHFKRHLVPYRAIRIPSGPLRIIPWWKPK